LTHGRDSDPAVNYVSNMAVKMDVVCFEIYLLHIIVKTELGGDDSITAASNGRLSFNRSTFTHFAALDSSDCSLCLVKARLFDETQNFISESCRVLNC
jgi:hypothetical protein